LAIDQPKQVNANDFSWLMNNKPRKFVKKDLNYTHKASFELQYGLSRGSFTVYLEHKKMKAIMFSLFRTRILNYFHSSK
jgi:hypothetical protein